MNKRYNQNDEERDQSSKLEREQAEKLKRQKNDDHRRRQEQTGGRDPGENIVGEP